MKWVFVSFGWIKGSTQVIELHDNGSIKDVFMCVPSVDAASFISIAGSNIFWMFHMSDGIRPIFILKRALEFCDKEKSKNQIEMILKYQTYISTSINHYTVQNAFTLFQLVWYSILSYSLLWSRCCSMK